MRGPQRSTEMGDFHHISGWSDNTDARGLDLNKRGDGYSVVVRDTLAGPSPTPDAYYKTPAAVAHSSADNRSSTLHQVPRRLQFDKPMVKNQQKQPQGPPMQQQHAQHAHAPAHGASPDKGGDQDQSSPSGPFKYKPGKYVRVSRESYFDDGLFASPPKVRGEPVSSSHTHSLSISHTHTHSHTPVRVRSEPVSRSHTHTLSLSLHLSLFHTHQSEYAASL